jgi:hypothetical protein
LKPEAVLITKPNIDFNAFLSLSRQALGRSIASKADACQREMSDAEKFLCCLGAILTAKANPGFIPSLLHHVSFSIFIGAENRDMQDILQCSAGMPFVIADTIDGQIQIGVITGTFAQWRDAVKSGSESAAELPVRQCFNRNCTFFKAADLNVWTDFRAKAAPDQTFDLEDKRKN